MTTSTMGFGEAAETIDATTQRRHRYLRDSNTLGIQPALDELSEVWDQCREAGWDGHDALPVEQITLAATRCLLDSLPYAFPLPSLGAEPDGQLTLEWRKARHRVLSVSVDPDGYLHYAGIFGTNKRYGTLTVFSSAPAELLQMVRDL